MTYTLTDLGPGTALDVNDSGSVVGVADLGGWYKPANGPRITIKSRTPDGFQFTARQASQIENIGDSVIGDFVFVPNDLTSLKRFSWSPGAQTVNLLGDFPAPPSFRTKNATHSIATQGGVAVVIEGGYTKDLNYLVSAPGWLLTSAHAINASGQIVGGGLLNGVQHAYLLTPIKDKVEAVQSYAGFYIKGQGGNLVKIMARDTEWNGEWRELQKIPVVKDPQLWVDTSTPRRRQRDYKVVAV